jgi:hypothetical protein
MTSNYVKASLALLKNRYLNFPGTVRSIIGIDDGIAITFQRL